MGNKRIIIIVIFFFIVGIFSISISTSDFFFTTKYYKTPIKAYNADSTYDALYGNTSVQKEIGRISLDNKTCLFVGEIDENNFVVNEMDVKNGKYSSKGISYFYDSSETLDDTKGNVTTISNDYVKWNIFYSKSNAESIANAFSIKSFTLSNGIEFYIVLTQGD